MFMRFVPEVMTEVLHIKLKLWIYVCVYVCLFIARECIYQFARNLACIRLETIKRSQKSKNSKKVS
jgi:hypothetical protein